MNMMMRWMCLGTLLFSACAPGAIQPDPQDSGIPDASAPDAGPFDADAGQADLDIPDPSDQDECPAPQILCDGSCTDIIQNPLHCGDCFIQCLPAESCINGSCTPDCPEECQDGQRRCHPQQPDQVEVCQTIDGCPGWTAESCPAGQTCQGDGICSCQECTQARDRRCAGAASELCGAYDSNLCSPDACLRWEAWHPCPVGFACNPASGTCELSGQMGDCYLEPHYPEASLEDLRPAYTNDPDCLEEIGLTALLRRFPAGHDHYLHSGAARVWHGDSFNLLMRNIVAITRLSGSNTNELFYRLDLTVEIEEVPTFPLSDVDFPGLETLGSVWQINWAQISGLRTLLVVLHEDCRQLGVGAILGEYADPPETNGSSTINQPGNFVRWSAISSMYVLQLYLRQARLHHPSLYQQMQSSPGIVEAVKLEWLRLNYFLPDAERYDNIGILPPLVSGWPPVHSYANLNEISLFIGRQVDESSCLH